MRILIAEDDNVLADGLTRSLRQSGYAVDHVKDGQSADLALSAQTFDLLILDLGLPKMTGLEVLKRLRARNSMIPVLILTAADSTDERVKGLDSGADDYMAKPFALTELEARVRALTRRGSGGGPTVVKHGPLNFDQQPIAVDHRHALAIVFVHAIEEAVSDRDIHIVTNLAASIAHANIDAVPLETDKLAVVDQQVLHAVPA